MSTVTLATIKAIGRIDFDTHDAELQILLDGAESFVEAHCVIKLTATTITDERQDGGNRQLWPEQALPVTSVESIEDSWDSDAVVNSDLYFNTDTRVLLQLDAEWGIGELRWKISYTGGYTTETLPAGLKNAIIGLTLLAYDNPEGMARRGNISWEKLADQGNLIAQLDHFSLRKYVE